MTLIYILLATILNGMMGLAGSVTFLLPKRRIDLVIKSLVAFSAGTLFCGSLFHLTAESLEKIGTQPTFYILTLGFLSFFVLERYLWYHHCHEGGCEVHPVSYLILIGDAVHNLIDGMIIAAAFIADIKIGLVTTAMVIIHEIPQELGDFGVLVHSGFSPKRALLLNTLSQLSAVFGGVLGYFALSIVEFSNYLLPFAAGGFIYVATADLIPEIHRHSEQGKAMYYFLLFVLGISLMITLKFLGE
ncbi:MAG: ZIP family metal transporter [Actinobacteria bacterium]|nr:ZIP family metal transporter [Actinomycetota bacterium]